MKNKLESLLNSLIERGWKPYGIEKDDIEVCEYSKDKKKISIGYMNWISPSKGDYDWLFMSLRDITNKESGLWQFVCKNEMINDKDLHERIKDIYEYDDGLAWKGIDYKKGCNSLNYEYRLIESSLKDESELEDFLLSNIVIKDEE